MAKNIDELLKEALIPVEEQPYEVPENWVWTKVEKVFVLKSGVVVKDVLPFHIDGLPYIKVSDMNHTLNQIDINISENIVSDKNRYLRNIIPSNSIIFPKRGGAISTNKKRKVLRQIIVDPNIMALIIPRSLLLNYWYATIDLWTLNSGTSIPQINNKDINPLKLPIPPLSEQQRIVTKIESLFYKIDKAKALIVEAREGLENRRAAILAKVFRGELTEKWREENDVRMESWEKCLLF